MLMISPAKINIFLYLHQYYNKRFQLQTLFCKIPGLHDEILIEESDKLEVISQPYHIENNIVEKVLKELKISNVRITINKKIPIDAGLGGGSSNAATVLQALSNDYFKNLAIARKLGYDIEFFLYETDSVLFNDAEDKREIVNLGFFLPLLLIIPDFPLSTAQVFYEAKYDIKLNRLDTSFLRLDVMRDIYSGHNELYKYAFRVDKRIETVISAINQCDGIIFSRMSGSGSSCFGVFQSIEDAQAACEEIKKSYPSWLYHVVTLRI